MDDLETLQERFFRLISQARPVGDAAHDDGAAPLSRWIASRDEDDASMRLAVYAQMYFARLRDSLREDYPALAVVLGDAFDTLIAEYLESHPSERPSLHALGARLPSFVAMRSTVRSDAADLARLEWARVVVFAEADAELLDEQALARTPRENFGARVLTMVPAARLVHVAHDVEPVWLAADRGTVVPGPAPKLATLVVWRHGFTVRHRAASSDEARALALLARGARVDAICDALGGDADVADAASRAFAVQRMWVADGLVGRAKRTRGQS